MVDFPPYENCGVLFVGLYMTSGLNETLKLVVFDYLQVQLEPTTSFALLSKFICHLKVYRNGSSIKRHL